MKKLLFFAVGAFFMLFTACNTESVSLEGSWIIETAYGQPVMSRLSIGDRYYESI